jgi:hypothetical protein
MPLRLAVRFSVFAALLTLPAAAQAADVVRPSSVTARQVVPEGGASTVRLHCPPRAVALNAAVTRKGAGVEVRRSVPGADAGDWRFRLADLPGAGSRRVSTVLRCVRLALPSGVSGTRLDVKTRRRPGFAIPAGGTTAVRLRCGRAWVATGYGLEAGSDVRLASVVPVPHGWNFRVENTGNAPTTAGVSVRCLRHTVTARGGGAVLRFRASRPAFRHTITQNGTVTVLYRCGAGRFSLAAGGSVDPLRPIEDLPPRERRRRAARLPRLPQPAKRVPLAGAVGSGQ